MMTEAQPVNDGPASNSATTEAGDLRSAGRVLALEVAGLKALAKTLDSRFSHALDVMYAMDGRVIVTGMGKSGHIARKIAATLASTGTPALFVHPAEASHGDLGMITAEDVIIALSNSGETPELADLVTYAKRYSIPLIAITGRSESALGDAADVTLTIPDTGEACSLGLAPTTSTTVMLALGDCLAVAMLERRGFSPADFRVFHPGGRLGRRLLHVGDIMHVGDSVPLVPPGTSMADALIAMSAKGFGCTGIARPDRRLIGVVTDGDLRRHMSNDLTQQSVDDVMTRNPKTIGPDALASEALAVMNARTITNLFVVDDGLAVGIIHVHDCLRSGVA